MVGCVCFKYRADFGRLQPRASQTHSREVPTILVQCTGTSDLTAKHLQLEVEPETLPGRAQGPAYGKLAKTVPCGCRGTVTGR